MLFHVFASQQERRNYGGSAFVEIQFCRLPSGTGARKLVATGSISHWQDDSLYVDDVDLFDREYGHIFGGGMYNDRISGRADLLGINYYAPALIDGIIEKIRRDRPVEYTVLENWLLRAKTYNGFYILGI